MIGRTTRPGMADRLGGGFRMAVSVLTVLPAGRVGFDRDTARWGMSLAALVGLLVGGAGALVLAGSGLVLGPLPSAGLAVAAMALLTRGLHLDGLADLADGLGTGRPATEALAVMKKSDIGPFGVIALVLTLLIQVSALAEAPWPAVVVAAVTGRLAIGWGCRQGVPAARPEGLGALVAGVVRPGAVLAATAAAAGLAGLGGLAYGGARPAVLFAGAVAAGLAVAAGVLRHAVRRLGGITGDVLGASVELAATAALLVCAAA